MNTMFTNQRHLSHCTDGNSQLVCAAIAVRDSISFFQLFYSHGRPHLSVGSNLLMLVKVLNALENKHGQQESNEP
jgi:hypothetical protein